MLEEKCPLGENDIQIPYLDCSILLDLKVFCHLEILRKKVPCVSREIFVMKTRVCTLL